LRTIVPSKQFGRDLKRMVKRGKSPKKLGSVIQNLQSGEALEKKHRPHALSGIWSRYMECHIEPDWLLIYQLTRTELRLVRTGSHSDLF
jgi:mRNA interferase YafQ